MISTIYEQQSEPRPDKGKVKRRSETFDPMIRIANREMTRAEAENARVAMATGNASYCAAVLDPESKRWKAIVMENIAPQRFKRRESMPLFATSDEAYESAERLLLTLEGRKRRP